MLSTNKLTKKFGDLTAVDRVTWEISEGQTKAIIGPNGAGKTTFFNMLSGILTPEEGTVTFKGTDITDLPLEKRAQLGIAKSYQISNIFDGLTPLENVRIATQRRAPWAQTYAVHKSATTLTETDERAQEVLESLGLGNIGDVKASNLSHGNKRKLEIGIGLATDPDILLLDEPTAGMAADERTEMVDLLKRLGNEENLTMVIVEHNIEIVFELASNVTVLHNGAKLKEGTPDEITEDEKVQEIYLGSA